MLGGEVGVRSSESRKRSSKGSSSSGGGVRPRIERRKEAVISRFNPGLIGKWKTCEDDDGMEESFKANDTLRKNIEKLMKGNSENRKEAVIKILQDYMNT